MWRKKHLLGKFRVGSNFADLFRPFTSLLHTKISKLFMNQRGENFLYGLRITLSFQWLLSMISNLWRMVGAIWVISLHFERTSVHAPCCYFSPSYWTPPGKSFWKQVCDRFKTNELIPERTSYLLPSQKPHKVSTPIQNRIDSTQDKNKNQGCNLTSIWLLQDIYWPLSCQPPCTCLVMADFCWR